MRSWNDVFEQEMIIFQISTNRMYTHRQFSELSTPWFHVDSQTGAVMCSYNKVNNTPACRVLESLVDVASIQLSNIGPIGISISEIEEIIMKCIYIILIYTSLYDLYYNRITPWCCLATSSLAQPSLPNLAWPSFIQSHLIHCLPIAPQSTCCYPLTQYIATKTNYHLKFIRIQI